VILKKMETSLDERGIGLGSSHPPSLI